MTGGMELTKEENDRAVEEIRKVAVLAQSRVDALEVAEDIRRYDAYERAWEVIAQSQELAFVRKKLSIHELRTLIRMVADALMRAQP